MRKQVSSQWLIMLPRHIVCPVSVSQSGTWTFHKTGGNRVVRYYQRDALNVRLSKTLQQRTSVLWRNWLQPGQSSGHVSDWQKGYSVQHTNEMAELIVVFIFWLNFSPCRLGQVVETIIPIGLNYSARHQYKLHEWRVDSCKRTSRLQKTATNIRHALWVWGKRLPNLPFPFLPRSGFWWCRFYRCRFYSLPFLPVAFFTRCPFYRCPFYRLPNLQFPFLPWSFLPWLFLPFPFLPFTHQKSVETFSYFAYNIF